ncbi:MAG TPA: serine/threonine-protein kinase [Candidatus Acidoferrales bacterium]|jgi:serine/threonine protein kinase/tetratricopeptide (TPR) repeat protein|nr:serine/threonine-protein kinase [Candidatus Acidoferrales bacterium]
MSPQQSDDRGYPVNISALSGDPAADSPQSTMCQARGLIGPYQLLQPIGSGGMGEVWLAEQTRPVRRRVALKLIKAGMDTGEVVARFQSERQALALMDHPSIAKVFDAGSTPQGRPYFAMEYITGVPITMYCDQHRMTVPQRLELFVQVCEGVQHAHQKAIIHRDLKPSNILVGEVDGKPVPRIIDFGIAKAISQLLTAETLLTQTGAIMGTPAYMSPEQAGSSGVDVDTRTDVYSLGVVLYELLVGVRPLDFHELAYDDVLRRLRDEEAPRPSTRLRTVGGQSSATAEARSADLPSLARQLRGDLDAIALKALEKDRSRRYGSPSDLAADIKRYLNNETVLAVPPSAVYKARKFARRYRAALITIGAFVLVLILAAAVSILQSVRANSEAAVAQAVSDFLQNDLLAQASTANQSGSKAKPDPDLKVRTALDRAAVRIAGEFNQQPVVEAAIRDTIGQAYMDLGLYPEARTQLERALDLHRGMLGARNPKTLKTISRLGWTVFLQGKYADAEALLGQALQISRRVLGPEHLSTLLSMSNLANVYWAQGKYAQAELLHGQTLEIRRRVLGPEHRDTLGSVNNLANVYALQGKYAQAETLHSQTLEIRRRLLGTDHPDTLSSMNNLANVYDAQGNRAQAELLYSQTLEIKRRVLGPDHPNTLISMNNLAETYSAQAKYAQAQPLYRHTLEIRRRLLGPEHPDTMRSMQGLADVYSRQGKYAQAEALYTQTLEIRRRVLPPEHPDTLNTLIYMAAMYQRQGRYALAATYAEQALAGGRHTLGSQHATTMTLSADLALAYLSQRKVFESEPLAREAFDFYRKTRPDDWERFRSESLLGATLAEQKKYAEAEPLLLEGYRGMLARKDRMGVPARYYLDCAREWLIQMYQAWGKPERAAEWRKM